MATKKTAEEKIAAKSEKLGNSTMGGKFMVPKNPHFLEDEEFMMNQMRIRVYFITDILGTWSNNKQLVSDFISNSYGKKKVIRTETSMDVEQELAFVPENPDGVPTEELKAMTVFPRNPITGEPVMMGYQMKGFFKAAAKACRNRSDSKSSAMTAYLSRIDQDVNIIDKYAEIEWGPDNRFHSLQRPLRAETAQGPRVALANSEQIMAGAHFDITVSFPNDKYLDLLVEWLNYGYYVGLLQWRNAGYGRFMYQILDENGTPVAGNLSPTKLEMLQKEWVANYQFALENERNEQAEYVGNTDISSTRSRVK